MRRLEELLRAAAAGLGQAGPRPRGLGWGQGHHRNKTHRSALPGASQSSGSDRTPGDPHRVLTAAMGMN